MRILHSYFNFACNYEEFKYGWKASGLQFPSSLTAALKLIKKHQILLGNIREEEDFTIFVGIDEFQHLLVPSWPDNKDILRQVCAYLVMLYFSYQ